MTLRTGEHPLTFRCLPQQAGLAGIVLKYSTPGTSPSTPADRVVVPADWFTHLPAGYLPGLAVQVCPSLETQDQVQVQSCSC